MIGSVERIDTAVAILVQHGARLCGEHGGDHGSPLDVALDVSELRKPNESA